MIQKVGELEIRDTANGLHVEEHVSDEVLVELISRAAERYEGSLAVYGPADFQLRIAPSYVMAQTRTQEPFQLTAASKEV